LSGSVDSDDFFYQHIKLSAKTSEKKNHDPVTHSPTATQISWLSDNPIARSELLLRLRKEQDEGVRGKMQEYLGCGRVDERGEIVKTPRTGRSYLRSTCIPFRSNWIRHLLRPLYVAASGLAFHRRRRIAALRRLHRTTADVHSLFPHTTHLPD
jgi:hypothetical protein